MPAAGKPGGLPVDIVFGERWTVGSKRERASRQVAGRRLGPVRHGRKAGSLLAEAQAGHEQTSQSLRNHRPRLDQTYLELHFDVSRILETWKSHQGNPRVRGLMF